MMRPEAKIAAGHRYMVLCGKSLLAQGVAYLLKADEGIEVALVNMEQGDLMEATRFIKPDVLILDVDNLEDLGGFLARLLREQPTMKIVGLDPLESAIYILRPHQRPVGNTEEFFAALREEI